MLGRTQALTDANTANYNPYMGQLSAGSSPLQDQAYGRASQLQTPASIGNAANSTALIGTQMGTLNYTPQTQASTYTAPANTSYQPGTMAPVNDVTSNKFTQQGTASEYMNPYMQNVVDMQQRDAQRQADIATTGRHSDQTKQGAFGGSRGAIMDAEAARNLAQQKGDIQAQGLNQAYQQAQGQFNADQGRNLTAQQVNQQAGLTTGAQNFNAANQASQFGISAGMQNAGQAAQYGLAANNANTANSQFGANYGLQALQGALGAAGQQGSLGMQQNQSGLANLNAMMTMGNQQQATEQAGITADQAAFNAERDNPYKQLQFQQSMLSSMPLQAQSYNVQQNPLSAAANAVTGVNTLFGAK
jgi:hypothetical protein